MGVKPDFVRPRPLLVAVMVACAAWLVVHEVRVVGFDGISLGPLSSRFAHDVLLLIVAGACLARGVLVRAERTAWLLIGIGVLGWTFGEIYYTAVLWDESSPPIPSPADLGYLALPALHASPACSRCCAAARSSRPRCSSTASPPRWPSPP